MAAQSETKKQVDAVRDDLAHMRDDLERLRDTIRLKMHLGSMELKQRFEELEPQVNDFERRAERVTGDVGKELREGWSHLKKALERIKNELEKPTH